LTQSEDFFIIQLVVHLKKHLKFLKGLTKEMKKKNMKYIHNVYIKRRDERDGRR